MLYKKLARFLFSAELEKKKYYKNLRNFARMSQDFAFWVKNQKISNYAKFVHKIITRLELF